MRWDPGFLTSGSRFESFWSGLANSGSLARSGLFIAGRGFDPRTALSARALVRAGFPIAECRLIRMVDPLDSPDRVPNERAARNEDEFRSLFSTAKIDVVEIETRNVNGRLVGASRMRNLVSNWTSLNTYTDVIVDITALPPSISFPLLGGLISQSDSVGGSSEAGFNLHCVVCENPDLDELIVAEGGHDPEFIEPYRGRGGRSGEAEPITIWALVLGERKEWVLRKIHDMLRPEEIKPFLPFPSRNPRRGDDLVAEYHSLLFDTWGVGPREFIFADERDPFDIYRQLGGLAQDYTQSLSVLGTANTVISGHSSKLLSLGAVLAAFEFGLGIVHVEPTNYSLDVTQYDPDKNELFEVWLTGEPYGTS